MYETLYQYLVHHKVLPLPGFGTFLLERRSAEADYAAREIHAPVYRVSLEENLQAFPRHFFSWLAHQLDLNDREAMSHFHDFAEEAKRQVNEGQVIRWNGVGQLSLSELGLLRFEPEILQPGEPVRAFKVLRGDAQHLVRVGEDHRTSGQMTEMLVGRTERKTYNLLWPSVLALLAVLFIGWYLSTNGVRNASTSNRSKIPLEERTVSYEIRE